MEEAEAVDVNIVIVIWGEAVFGVVAVITAVRVLSCALAVGDSVGTAIELVGVEVNEGV